MHMTALPGYTSYLVTVLVLGLVMFLRLRRMRAVQPLRPGRLWLVPALYAIVTAALLMQAPPTGAQWLWLAIALAIGLGIGWWRGTAMRITVDPVHGTLNQQGSPAAMLILLALVLVRQGMQAGAGELGFKAAFVTDLLTVLALGLFAATRAEMFLRARRMLAAARAG